MTADVDIMAHCSISNVCCFMLCVLLVRYQGTRQIGLDEHCEQPVIASSA